MSKLLYALAIVVVLLIGTLLGRLMYGSEPARASTPAVSATLAMPDAVVAEPSSKARPSPKPHPMRARIEGVVTARVEPMRSEAEVIAYLQELETQARDNGRVTALEVEPGLVAIARLRDGLPPEQFDATRLDFLDRMASLSTQLDGRTTAETSLTSESELQDYLDTLTVRARERGQVTADDVGEGIAAIDRAAQTLGTDASATMTNEFTERMATLSAELEQG